MMQSLGPGGGGWYHFYVRCAYLVSTLQICKFCVDLHLLIPNMLLCRLQQIESQGVTWFVCFCFFQLCLYLTVWLAEDCHFAPNAPNVICGLTMTKTLQNVHIWRVKMPILEAKIPKFAKRCFRSMCPMTKIGIFCGPKLSNKIEISFFVPNVPKSHLGVSNDKHLLYV